MSQYDLAIIGGASLDTLLLDDQPHPSIGGAGLYTALAARWAGARPLMYAPRPDPMPAALAPAAARIGWAGPEVAPEALPRFTINHHAGGADAIVGAVWGAEAELEPAALPREAREAPLLYCGPLADPALQLAFVDGARARGQLAAAGTYFRAATAKPEAVHALLEAADLFFCNEAEATRLFGDPELATTGAGKLLFVTLGARGVLVVQGTHRSHIPAPAVQPLDPTGAGDTFCGVTLALTARGVHPVLAARQGVACAAAMVERVGPARLLEGGPLPALGSPAVRVDEGQVERVAALIGALPEVEPFPFTGDLFPPVGDPGALDFFFAATLQQFSFWHHDGERYTVPFIAPLGGRMLKGSDFLWATYLRWLDEEPRGLTPAGQAAATSRSMARWYRDDAGEVGMPAFEEHVAVAQRYGADMGALGWSPATILEEANRSARPLATFLAQLDHIGGYKEDPLRKKAVLLAVILQQRPERFLRSEPGEPVPPIIDYHLQRSCLRTGLVAVEDEILRQRLERRGLVGEEAEWAVRFASYEAVAQLQARSGKSMGAVDWFFFGARRFCPEMSEPECHRCAVEPACVQRKALFQPVRRTTFY